jgi:hypothetical protein
MVKGSGEWGEVAVVGVQQPEVVHEYSPLLQPSSQLNASIKQSMNESMNE